MSLCSDIQTVSTSLLSHNYAKTPALAETEFKHASTLIVWINASGTLYTR